MNRLTNYRYSVVQGEEISFHITPVGAGPRVTAAQDGNALENTGTDSELVFTFPISDEGGGRHRAMFVFSFVSGDAHDARFDINIQSSDGTDETPRPVRKRNVNKSPTYTFDVEA